MKNKICCKAMESRIKPTECAGIVRMDLMDKDFNLKQVLTVYKKTARDRWSCLQEIKPQLHRDRTKPRVFQDCGDKNKRHSQKG